MLCYTLIEYMYDTITCTLCGNQDYLGTTHYTNDAMLHTVLMSGHMILAFTSLGLYHWSYTRLYCRHCLVMGGELGHCCYCSHIIWLCNVPIWVYLTLHSAFRQQGPASPMVVVLVRESPSPTFCSAHSRPFSRTAPTKNKWLPIKLGGQSSSSRTLDIEYCFSCQASFWLSGRHYLGDMQDISANYVNLALTIYPQPWFGIRE